MREGDDVSPSYDPMLAKLIVHAPSRAEALQRMRRALDDFVILGTTTNVAFLRDLCDLEAVTSAKTSTTTLDEAYPNGWRPDRLPKPCWPLARSWPQPDHLGPAAVKPVLRVQAVPSFPCPGGTPDG